MSLPIPSTISPSKVSSFTNCPLSFRLSNIDKMPQEPSLPAIKGTTVHKVLELLFGLSASNRTIETAVDLLTSVIRADEDGEIASLMLDNEGVEAFESDGRAMLERYFSLEDPTVIEPVGREVMLEITTRDRTLRGIIDRLDMTADGDLIVTDYKTGKAPPPQQVQNRLVGVHFYAYLCQEFLGKRPIEVRLMYLGANATIISAYPTEQTTRGIERKTMAVWNAVDTACERNDFRPKKSPLCNWCSYQEFCPEFGGTPPEPPTAPVTFFESTS